LYVPRVTGTEQKPLITANQVTLVRLALIPLPCSLLYQGTNGQYAALIIATLLGCTDFVDGYLARKYGGTVLGGLMDPIADKVFIAATFLPAVDLKWVPSWMVALLFVREFFVTAARTSYERRDLQLKSSYLARYKTWVQMCGVGVLMLLSASTPDFMDWFLGALALLPVVGYLGLRFLARRRWKGAGWFAISFASLLLIHRSFGGHILAIALMYFIVGVTYASGLGYLFGVGKLKGRGRVVGGEIVRLTTSIALPIVAIGAQSRVDSPSWAIIALVAFELAHGGLDNLLAHHRAEDGAVRWGARLISEIGLLVAAWLTPSTTLSRSFAFAALFVSAVGLVIAFVQKRRWYLDEKPRAVPATAATKPAAVL
jgi:CDP-diacylglycerol--glycerol-3-phosphate 3-phosphatidyltransferase